MNRRSRGVFKGSTCGVLLTLVLGGDVGCGPAPVAQPAKPVASAPATPTVSQTAPPPPVVARSPATFWDLLPSTGPSYLWIQGKELRSSSLAPLLRLVMSSAAFGRDIAEIETLCGFKLLDTLDELLVMGDVNRDDPNIVVMARGGSGPEQLLACTVKNARPQATLKDIEGHRALVPEHADDVGAVILDDILVVGKSQTLRSAVTKWNNKSAQSASAPAAMNIGSGSIFALKTQRERGELLSITGGLQNTNPGLSLSLSLEPGRGHTASEFVQEAKKAIDGGVAQLTNNGKNSALAVEVQRIVSSIKISAEGKNVLVNVTVTDDEAGYFRALALVVESAERRYVMASRTAEAKNTIGAIARSLMAAAEREEVDKQGRLLPHRFPVSGPKTLSKVPAGTAEMIPDSVWAQPGWKAIKFRIDHPSRYSYSFTTSSNGRKAIIVAEGDLNGDHKLSRFEMTVEMMPDNSFKQSPIKETEPYE